MSLEIGMYLGVMCSGTVKQVVEKVHLASRSGFKHVQLTLQEDIDEKAWQQLFEACRQQGVRVAALGCYLNLLKPHDPGISGTTIEGVRSAMRVLPSITPDLGSRKIVVWSGTYGPTLLEGHPQNRSIETWDAAAERVTHLVHDLLQVEGTLLFEPYYTHFLGSPRDYILFFREVERRAGLRSGTSGPFPLGVVLDPPNFLDAWHLSDPMVHIEHVVTSLSAYTGLVHLKDIASPKVPADRHPTLPKPGEGLLDYERYMRLIRSHVTPSCVGVAEHLNESDPDDVQRTFAFLTGLISK